MTGLFDRKPEKMQEVCNVTSSQFAVSSEKPVASRDSLPEFDAREVDRRVSEIKEDSPTDISHSPVDLGDFGDDGIKFSEEVTPTTVIRDVLGEDKAFAVKGVTPNPSGFMAAQVQADYHEELFGVDNKASEMLRALCTWASRYNSSKRGERTKIALGALKQAREEELMIEKETKGLFNR